MCQLTLETVNPLEVHLIYTWSKTEKLLLSSAIEFSLVAMGPFYIKEAEVRLNSLKCS